MTASFLSAFVGVMSGNAPWTMDDELVWRAEVSEPGATHRIDFNEPLSLARARLEVVKRLSAPTHEAFIFAALLNQADETLSELYPKHSAAWSPSACELEGVAQKTPAEMEWMRAQAEVLADEAESAADQGHFTRAEDLRARMGRLTLEADCWERLASLQRGWWRALWERRLEHAAENPYERLAQLDAAMLEADQAIQRHERAGETALAAQSRYELRMLCPSRDVLAKMLAEVV